MTKQTVQSLSTIIYHLDVDYDLKSYFHHDLHLFRHALGAFKSHKKRKRGVTGFFLTLDQWIKLWFAWDPKTNNYYYLNRGNKRHNYVMSRKEDKGPYSVDNVFIQTSHENLTEPQVKSKLSAASKGKAKSKEHVKSIIEAHRRRGHKVGQRRKKRRKGIRIGARRVICFEGFIYPSIKECHSSTGISRVTIIKKLKDDKWPNSFYIT